MTWRPSSPLVVVLSVVGIALLVLCYFKGFFEEGVKVRLVSDRCMLGSASGATGGAGLHPVKTMDWSSAEAVPLADVVVLKGVTFYKQALAARVLAGPGSTVEIDGHRIKVNDVPLRDEPTPHSGSGSMYLREHLEGTMYKVFYSMPEGLPRHTFTVGGDELFVLGDTRSEYCLGLLGVVPFSAIQGGW
jgi:hypothetical protein